MANNRETTRRDFLASSAKVAGIAALAASAAPTLAAGKSTFEIKAGPAPKTDFGPDGVIRVGLIGTGNRGRRILDAALMNKNIQIVAIADPNEPNAKQALELIQKKGQEKAPEVISGEEGWKKLLAREDIDAVQLATYPVQHAEMYLACFGAGKHFYGEKPMCVAADEADALVEGQKKNPKVVVQIGFQRRSCTRYQNAIQQIHGGEYGKLRDAYAAWNLSGGPLGLPDQGTAVWFGRKKLSGDWMIEQACHTWDVLNWVAGKLPIAATAVGQTGLFKHLDPERDVTDYYVAIIEYPDDFTVSYSHNWVCPHKDEGKFSGVYERIVCEKAGLALNDGKVYWRDPKPEPVQLPGEASEYNMTNDSVAAFYKAVRGEGKAFSGVENGRMATLVGLMVRKAVYERRRVTMKEIMG